MKRILVIVSGLLFSTMLFAQKQINDPNAQVREAKDFQDTVTVLGRFSHDKFVYAVLRTKSLS